VSVVADRRVPDVCTYCQSGNVNQNLDGDYVCGDCGFVVLHADNEQPRYIQ
jgi:transcription initiation factor TFIIIB Brf1 subunit/transcription initiation factor TFIIB